ncbi:uncharacterized protein LOC109845930 [Asparagus officinalis]|uniref:uncharacterized protein LOC109845930 n=1 Tax=Asparagus officinalis TaxID=4686 RepID=UPI00098E1A16|nr:uncharacterized protein LOC109845930 [Asparagus officinalis]
MRSTISIQISVASSHFSLAGIIHWCKFRDNEIIFGAIFFGVIHRGNWTTPSKLPQIACWNNNLGNLALSPSSQRLFFFHRILPTLIPHFPPPPPPPQLARTQSLRRQSLLLCLLRRRLNRLSNPESLEAPRNVAPIDGDSDEDGDLQNQQAQRTTTSCWREQMANTMWEDGTNVAQGV